MKRRRLFNTIATGSLVLCVAMIALWIRSYLRWDMLVRKEGNYQIVARSNLGLVSMNFDILDRSAGYSFYWRHERWDTDLARLIKSNLGDSGFRYQRLIQTDAYFPKAAPSVFYHLQTPDWFISLLLAVFPAIFAISFWRRRTKVQSMCSSCGYDLRATPDRCPECGTILSKE